MGASSILGLDGPELRRRHERWASPTCSIPDGSFPTLRESRSAVDLERLTGEDEEILQRMVRRHYEYTRSERAEEVLRKWNSFAPKFVKVFPKDLKLALDARLNARTGDG